MKTMLGLIGMLGLLIGVIVRAEEPAVRISHFSNITHAQALVGHASGAFE